MMFNTRKYVFFVFSITLSYVTSFTSTTKNNRIFALRVSTKLQSRADSSDKVKAALETSKQYGATSKEARLAWEEVEEIDSSDNSVAYSGGVTDEECHFDPTSKKCKEYEDKMKTLGALLEENKAKLYAVKSLAQEVQSIQISSPSTPTDQPDIPMLKELIVQAKEATDKFGADSNEAKLAWESVEEVSASNNSVASLPTLEDECLVEAVEACAALEELGRVIILARSEGSGLNS